VTAPLLVFFTKTLTPGSGIPSALDFTVPVTEIDCANACEEQSAIISME
jgi:hypothetical protein